MSDIHVTGVDFVALQTRDHAAAAKFYGETLGLPFVKSWGTMPASEFQAGNLTLAVMQSDAFGMQFAPSSTMVALAVEFRGGVLDSPKDVQVPGADPS
jgi:catechol 2,3-dioxygenase-like lactoylglutathione lyase family enzyme